MFVSILPLQFHLLHFISSLLNYIYCHCMLAESYVKYISNHSSICASHNSVCCCCCCIRQSCPVENLYMHKCKKVFFSMRYKTPADRNTHEWPQVPLPPCVPYSLLIHTSLCLPCAPPRQGQGAVVQVPAESLIIPPAFLLRGRAACSGENLFKDRCAYQTPALRPTPCGFHNYLLVRLPRHSSKTALNPSDSSSYTSCQRAGRSSTYWCLFVTQPFCYSSSSIIHTFKHAGRDLVGRGKALGVEI